jgi:hypothetical protein
VKNIALQMKKGINFDGSKKIFRNKLIKECGNKKLECEALFEEIIEGEKIEKMDKLEKSQLYSCRDYAENCE